MELWRTEVIEGKRPGVLSVGTVVLALVLHLAVFLAFGLFALCSTEKKETIIPIDLTVIVNENLDGVENEPPPLVNPPPPEPPKPKPKPRPKPEPKKPEPPKALEQIVTNVVKSVEKKKDEPKREPEKKKPEPKKPEPPKKTAKELREEKMKRIRDRMKAVNKPVTIEVKNAKASGNGRTARQTMSRAEIERRLLRQGYRPGTENQLAASEKQRCVSLIQMAIESKWDTLSPKVGNNGTVLLSVQLSSAGGLVNVRLAKGCGDALSDQAALSVARAVTSIPGLSAEFIAEFRKEPLTIRYNVKGR